MSSNHLFLLFLLLAVLPALLLLRLVRGRLARVVNSSQAAARAPSAFLAPWAPRRFQAPTASQAEPPRITMSEELIPRRDENNRWKALISESEAAVEQYFVPWIDMNLATFVRCITFRVFLAVFLGVDSTTLVFANLQQVTTALSDFYGDSKGKSALPPEVQNILCAWLPREQFPSSLDRIFPAYEALWRIIATLVVTCEDDETKVLRWMMLDFRDNPRDRQYSACFGGDGRSVSAITEDVAGRIAPIARAQHATTSTWPLNCVQYAPAAAAGNPPTVQEALKFAALLASKVIGRVGVRFEISGDGSTSSGGSPWVGRKILGVNRSPGHPAINAAETHPHTGTSRQEH